MKRFSFAFFVLSVLGGVKEAPSTGDINMHACMHASDDEYRTAEEGCGDHEYQIAKVSSALACRYSQYL